MRDLYLIVGNRLVQRQYAGIAKKASRAQLRCEHIRKVRDVPDEISDTEVLHMASGICIVGAIEQGLIAGLSFGEIKSKQPKAKGWVKTVYVAATGSFCSSKEYLAQQYPQYA